MNPRQVQIVEDAIREIGELRESLATARDQLRIVAIFERALFGSPPTQGFAPDVVFSMRQMLREAKDEAEAEDQAVPARTTSTGRPIRADD